VNFFYVENQRGGWQSHPWMMNTIYELMAEVAILAAHCKHHERAPPTSMMLHQGMSNHDRKN